MPRCPMPAGAPASRPGSGAPPTHPGSRPWRPTDRLREGDAVEEQSAPEERRPRRRNWIRRRELSLMTAAESTEGLSPELLAALALRRALGGGVARVDGVYVDGGHPMGRYLAGTFTDLIDCGLLAVADEDEWGLRRVTVTRSGQALYAQVCGILRQDLR